MDLTNAADPQMEILRRMTPEQRLRSAMMLWRTARKLKLAFLREQHPQASEAELKRLLNDAFLYARE
jgi:hypothetical protein